MKNIKLAFLLGMVAGSGLLLTITGCGFTSYYSSNRGGNQPAHIQEEMVAIRIEFEPKENYERIIKSSLRELLGGNNELTQKKYILMIYPQHSRMMAGIDPTGMSSVYKINMNTNFTLLDITDPKCSLNPDRDEDTEVNLMSKIQEKRFVSGYDEVESNVLNEGGSSTNRGRTLFYESRLNTLKQTCAVIESGTITASVDFVSNPTLLYGDWASERTAIELAGQQTAEYLFYKLIGILSLRDKKGKKGSMEEDNEKDYISAPTYREIAPIPFP